MHKVVGLIWLCFASAQHTHIFNTINDYFFRVVQEGKRGSRNTRKL